jgi:thiol-disulfide isomerase/thioredoxin
MRLLSISVLVTVLLFACEQGDRSKTVPSEISGSKVELIDFYGTHRCMTCEGIEENAKYTVEKFFKDEMEEGKLEFKTVNVDDEANYDIAEKFEATGTALFINVIKDGKEEHIDLTAFAFKKGTDRDEFSEELRAKLAEQLAGI